MAPIEELITQAKDERVRLEARVEKLFLAGSLAVLGACGFLLLAIACVLLLGSNALIAYTPLLYAPAGLFLVVATACIVQRAKSDAKLTALGVPGFSEPNPLIPPVVKYGSVHPPVRFVSALKIDAAHTHAQYAQDAHDSRDHGEPPAPQEPPAH